MRWLVNCVPAVASVVLSACCINITAPDKPGAGGGAGGSTTGGGAGGGSGGGGGGASASDLAQSGSRIRLKWAIAPDGTKMVLGYHDAQQGADCSWQRAAADGALHCVPVAAVSTSYPVQYFADASCTQAVAYTSGTPCAPPTLAQGYDVSSCPAGYRLFSLGAETHPAKIYVKTSTGCYASTVSSTMHVYPLGAETSASAYVRADATPAAGTGVTPVTLHADDGLTAPWGERDVGNDEDCFPSLLGADTRCVPSRVAYEYGFSESSCSQKLYSVNDGCGMPRFGGGSGTGACSPYYTTLTGSASTVYWKSGSSCTVLTGSGSTPHFTGGTPVPESTFPAATVGLFGDGRIKRHTYAWPGGFVQPYDFYDTQLGEACQLWANAIDGAPHCVPSTPGLYPSGYFADASCSQPLAGRSGSCSLTPKYAYGYVAPSCTGGAYTLKSFAVGGLHSGTVYVGTPGSCSVVTSPPSTLYDLGAEVPPASMASFTVQVD